MTDLERSENLILTGIPRSGTTLACALVDAMEDALCLSEPAAHFDMALQCESAAAYRDYVVGEFRLLRQALIRGESVADKRARDGSALTNYVERRGDDIVSRIALVNVQRALTPRFLLGIKHNAPYTAILPELVATGSFRIIAIVRNPITTILSWRSLNMPVSRGRLPTGEPFWPELRAIVEEPIDDLLARHVALYDLFCARYLAFRDSITIVRYEDLVAHPERLGGLLDRARTADIALSSTASPHYAWHEAAAIADRVAKHGSAWRAFYSTDDLVIPPRAAADTPGR